MRLWSLHPKYLDRQGLLAVWREGLLAVAVLSGKTAGYRHHPQLQRFRSQDCPVSAINGYMCAVYVEAVTRGYRFDGSKIDLQGGAVNTIPVTLGQLQFEQEHLRAKLAMEVADLWLAQQFTEEASVTECPDDFSCEENLKPYTGRFLISRVGLTVLTGEEWGQLFITVGDQPRTMLLPCGEGRFWLAPLRTTVNAVKDDTGSVVALEISLYGQVVRANRIDPLPLTERQVQAYAGIYHSDELATSYELMACKDGLKMSHSRHDEVTLVPTDIDTFEGLKRVGFLSFQRNEEKVTGFTLTGSRVRNLQFRKL